MKVTGESDRLPFPIPVMICWVIFIHLCGGGIMPPEMVPSKFSSNGINSGRSAWAVE